jgi:hypothetical protein
MSDKMKDEAKKLVTILRGMCEGGGEEEGVDIYADGYSPGDGDVFVIRAAQLLEQLAAPAPSALQLADAFDAAIPSGYKLVPIKPTSEMVDAALDAHEPLDGDEFDYRAEFTRTYRAMIAEAPAPAPTAPSDAQELPDTAGCGMPHRFN